MEHAATKAKYTNLPQMELGGEFPVEDIVTGEGGLLQVCIDGIEVLFADRKVHRSFTRWRPGSNLVGHFRDFSTIF